MAGKPGTNWKQVTPENRKKVGPLVRHYMKQAHPFTACVNDNTKRFGPDRAKRICAVVKDMGERTTKWRKGGGKMQEATADEGAYIESIFDEVMAPVLDAEGVTVADLADWAATAERAGILEAAPTGPLALELSDDEVGDLALLEAAATPPPLSNAKRRPGESLGDYGKRLKAGDKANATAAAAKKTRGGKNADFEKQHPRGRGGSWTLKAGDSGSEVRAVQRRVGAKTDGKFGTLTRAAIVRYQRRHGLQADGIVGRQTVAAMRGDKSAKAVKPGAMSAKDRAFLAKHKPAAKSA